MIFTCNHQHGVITNIITLRNFLLACSPNGAVMYISPLYVGSISDVELTKVCGFVDALKEQNVSGMSVMADRGFTIKDQLTDIGATLNIPPFMEGRRQLSKTDIHKGRTDCVITNTCGTCLRESKDFFNLERHITLEYE